MVLHVLNPSSMILQTHVHNLTAPEKEQFDNYLGKKTKKIQDLLESHYPDEDTIKLDVHMRKHDKHTAFECEYVLHLPRVHNAIVAREVKHSVTEPMDFALAKLEGQLVKHLKKLTKSA